MKKSTLITTIAMIVVVVVALSTATYAWFTSSRQAVATTTITVQSSSDWTIQQGTVAAGAVTFSPASDTINFNAALAGDVWAPNSTSNISVAPSNDNGTGVTVGGINWFTAKTNNNIHVATAITQNVVYPDVIRVLNTKSISPAENAPDQKNLKLQVIVNLGDQPTEAAKYAANALTFYIAKSSGDPITNGYNKPTDEVTATDDSLGGQVAGSLPGDPVAVNATTGLTKPNYQGTAVAAHKSASLLTQEQRDALGLGASDIYVEYEVSLGTVGYQQGINLAIYTWIEGYSITDASLGASLTINYAFSTATGE